MGQKPGENVSSETVLALIEQGMKVFSAIYKRIYRSLTSEFKKLFWLNSKYVDPQAYANILDSGQNVDALQDYNMEDVDVRPVADPNLTLDIQRLTKARALMETVGKHPKQNVEEILRRYYDALKIPDIDKLFVEQQGPDPQTEMLYMQMGIMRDKHLVEKQKMLAEIGKIQTEQILNIAKAEAAEAGPQLEQYKTHVQALGMWLKAQNEMLSKAQETGGGNGGVNQTGVPGMEAQPNNPAGLGVA
jgi:chaperonin GroES